jgi:predicted amidohydrolase YtcJ
MKMLLIILIWFCVLFLSSCDSQIKVDLILHHGKIFTAKNDSNFVEALAIKNGEIIATGDTEEILSRYIAGNQCIIDLQNKLVVPGFHDAHLHFWNGTKIKQQLDLRNIHSREKVIQKIKNYVSGAEPGSWILGRGWDHELWPDQKLPDKHLLDNISTSHYIYLRRVDGHASWVNSPVLEKFNYSSFTADPPGGKIMRYPNSLEPNGILFETAEDPLEENIPEPSDSVKYDWIKKTLPFANKLGLTSITDQSPLPLYPILAELEEKDELTLRINFWPPYHQNLDSIRQIIDSYDPPARYLKAEMIKIYEDGSLGSRTAYLKNDYDDDPGNKGLPQHPFEELHRMIRDVYDHNLYAGIHAIGDAGVTDVLDAYEKIDAADPERDYRFRIEHAQMLDLYDFSRFKELNVIASMQPSHCITDLHWAENRIGKRARYTYTWKSFQEQGVKLAFGTDWPVEPLNPMIGLYAAVTRKDTLGYPENGWYPEEIITIGQAIMAYTSGSAYAARNENWCGTLEPGKVADFVILNQDLFTCKPQEILSTKVLATYLEGKKIYNGD